MFSIFVTTRGLLRTAFFLAEQQGTSFIKTLKQEEIYVTQYHDLEHLRANITEFIEQHYNRCRLHSALDYRPPAEFEQESVATDSSDLSRAARMSFFWHGEGLSKQ